MAKATTRTEAEEQEILFQWIRESMLLQTIAKLKGALRWTHHVPNGFIWHPGTRAKAVRQGMRKGILDVVVPCPEAGKRNAGYHGLYVEMKRKGRKAEPEQIEFMDYLESVHYKHALCYTWMDAARVIVAFLGLTTYAEIAEGASWIQTKPEVKRRRRKRIKRVA